MTEEEQCERRLARAPWMGWIVRVENSGGQVEVCGYEDKGYQDIQ